MNQPIKHVGTAPPATEYVEFWNDTLAEKFERFREILMPKTWSPGRSGRRGAVSTISAIWSSARAGCSGS